MLPRIACAGSLRAICRTGSIGLSELPRRPFRRNVSAAMSLEISYVEAPAISAAELAALFRRPESIGRWTISPGWRKCSRTPIW